jgi:hypothetical protein
MFMKAWCTVLYTLDVLAPVSKDMLSASLPHHQQTHH